MAADPNLSGKPMPSAYFRGNNDLVAQSKLNPAAKEFYPTYMTRRNQEFRQIINTPRSSSEYLRNINEEFKHLTLSALSCNVLKANDKDFAMYRLSPSHVNALHYRTLMMGKPMAVGNERSNDSYNYNASKGRNHDDTFIVSTPVDEPFFSNNYDGVFEPRRDRPQLVDGPPSTPANRTFLWTGELDFSPPDNVDKNTLAYEQQQQQKQPVTMKVAPLKYNDPLIPPSSSVNLMPQSSVAERSNTAKLPHRNQQLTRTITKAATRTAGPITTTPDPGAAAKRDISAIVPQQSTGCIKKTVVSSTSAAPVQGAGANNNPHRKLSALGGAVLKTTERKSAVKTPIDSSHKMHRCDHGSAGITKKMSKKAKPSEMSAEFNERCGDASLDTMLGVREYAGESQGMYSSLPRPDFFHSATQTSFGAMGHDWERVIGCYHYGKFAGRKHDETFTVNDANALYRNSLSRKENSERPAVDDTICEALVRNQIIAYNKKPLPKTYAQPKKAPLYLFPVDMTQFEDEESEKQLPPLQLTPIKTLKDDVIAIEDAIAKVEELQEPKLSRVHKNESVVGEKPAVDSPKKAKSSSRTKQLVERLYRLSSNVKSSSRWKVANWKKTSEKTLSRGATIATAVANVAMRTRNLLKRNPEEKVVIKRGTIAKTLPKEPLPMDMTCTKQNITSKSSFSTDNNQQHETMSGASGCAKLKSIEKKSGCKYRKDSKAEQLLFSDDSSINQDPTLTQNDE